MRDYTYTASEDSIGDGWTDPAETVDRWNSHIAPVLVDATTEEMQENEDEPLVSVGKGMAKRAAEWAWEEFCGREAGESDELTQELAEELRRKIGVRSAAATLGSIKTKKKSRQSAKNGLLGGKPKHLRGGRPRKEKKG